MRLRSAPRSGNSYEVRLLLGLLGTRCDVIDYDTRGGETHAPGFLKYVNPDGKVPVLELEDGTMLPESGAILYYLAEGTPYLPEEKLERAQVLRWMFCGHRAGAVTPWHSLMLYLPECVARAPHSGPPRHRARLALETLPLALS